MDPMTLVTLIAVVVAAAMTGIALKTVWNEKQRSAARVAALADEIHYSRNARLEGILDDTPVAMREMFSTSAVPARQWFRGLVVLATGTAAAIVAAVAFTGEPVSKKDVVADGPSLTAPQPLELLALHHERVDDQLTVRGTIRNPAHASEIDHLTAVVLLFNPQGGFLTSGRAAVAAPALEPGAQSTFVVTLPRGTDAGRYRVSFRTDDQVIPHVDRRQIGAGSRVEVRS
jgi:hypothetical protein